MPTIAETLAQAKAYHRAGQPTEAVPLYQQVLAADSGNVEAHYLLGAACHALGQAEAAIASLAQAIRLRPDHAEAHNHLGAVLSQQGELDAAISSFEHAVRLRPASAEMSENLRLVLATRDNTLGNDLVAQGKLDEAAACFRRVVALIPEFADAHISLGAVLEKQDNLDEAAACCRRALELNPDLAEAHFNLGAVLLKQADVDEAIACYQRALELKPNFAEAHYNLGIAQKYQGRIEEAMASFQKALEAQPQFAAAHSTALLALQYHSGTTLAQLAAAHGEYDERHAAPLRATWRPHDNQRDPDRKLRLGFVSPDLGCHPVGYFLIRVLENLDGSQAETACYSDRLPADAMTNRLRAAATNWRNVRALSDEQLADQIRADRIDIAFDLAGHTGNNRLPAFARKPAPIAITWIGYAGTTGLKAMDYLLADRFEVPADAEPYVQERVLRMPAGYVCYDPPPDAPSVSPLPALARGYVTFGSFNNPAKITPQVVDVWARILRRVAGARLVLKYLGMSDPSTMRRLTDMFAKRGVDSSRLDLLGWSCHEDVLRQYQRIDVALDPFPYGGGLTTCESLWMGVPVVTCPGETFASRHALSHLSNVGLTETIADDLEGYVLLATGLATDLPRLAVIRARLRQQVAESPLCNGKRFAENFIDVLRGVWRRWCDGQPR